MKKTVLILFFAFNLCNAQTVQHESRKVFVMTLNVPNIIRNSNKAFNEIVTKNKIKRIICYRENDISSDIKFDKKGNIISKIENDNKSINESKYEYDEMNRMTKISFYSPNGNLDYGYEYKFNGPYKTEYKIGDTIPTKRTIELKEENIKIYSDYNSNQQWELSSIIFKNSDNSYDRELRYNKNGIVYQEFKHFHNKNELNGGTKSIQYYNGLKTNEKDYSAYKADINGNRIERYSAYSTDTLKLISTHKFNEENQVIENNYLSKLENFEYDANGFILSKTIKDRNGITILNFFYNNSLPSEIVKINEKNKSTFRYEYEFYK